MRILLATLGVMVVTSASALAAPVPSYQLAPNDPPIAGEVATFTSTSTSAGQNITEVAWDFDSDGIAEAVDTAAPFTADYVYPNAGSKTLRMVVTDDALPPAQTTAFFPISVNARPVSQFSFSPLAPVIGQEVLFRSFSYDPGGSGLAYAWDTDGDGYDDGTGDTTSRAFSTSGPKQVQLRVTDSDGVQATSTQTVTIGPAPANPLPVAQFSVTPSRPQAGEQVSLRSFSYDPGDGSIVSQRWDLDGDGDFDENVSGKTAFTVFSNAGERIVRLEVRDSDGGVQTETQNVTATAQPKTGLSLINPFPVARLAGSVYPGGVRVRLLEVRTPPRSRVVVRCSGRNCPVKKIGKTSKAKPVRFQRLSRFLVAGTVLKVSIRKGGQIGKFTRWRIRGGKLPQRRDLCLYPGQRKGRRCPAVSS